MPTITEIKSSTRKGRLIILLDGHPALEIAADVLAGRGLLAGSRLSEREVADVKNADDVHRAVMVAMRYLGYRPRSEKELNDRLRKAAFTPGVIASAMTRLRELGLADDTSFAKFWKEGREASRPRGRRLIKQELRAKGVDQEIILDTVSDVREEDGAYCAASKKARSMKDLEEKTFYRRLGTFLQRRGYSYDLSRRTVEKVWIETRHSPPEEA